MVKFSYSIISIVLFLLLETASPANFTGGYVTPGDSLYQSTQSKPAVTVEMTNQMTFVPDTVHIEQGETVQWENTSLLAHSVTGDPSQSTVEGSAKLPEGARAFNSGMMVPEQLFKHRFNEPGVYKYFCIPHEGARMYGWVIVE